MQGEAFEKLNKIIADIEAAKIESVEKLTEFRTKYLGSKNVLKGLMGAIRTIPNELKKDYGQLINQAKTVAQSKFDDIQSALEIAEETKGNIDVDLSAPGEPIPLGARHPISLTMNRIINIFQKIGFIVEEEREIEEDWYNFTAMNTPEDHPARDMQDTFYLKDDDKMLLRTHTSSVQSRVMTTQKPPLRIIAPGRVYRNETVSARAHCQFHQVEGLYIDKNVSFADLRQTILYYAREMYGPDAKIRLRPSYFPFTEPSAEVDVYWGLNNEIDYRITKGTGWLEIMGCGMVDPNVLENCGIDSQEYTGFAFGMGIERQAMLNYRVSDIRWFFENDVRFLEQFEAEI